MKLIKSISVLAAAVTGASMLSPVAGETVTLSIVTFNVYFLTELFVSWGQHPYQTPTVGATSEGTMRWSSTSGAMRFGINGGVVIFSKWPIKEQHQFIFKNYCGMDGLSNKGFVQVILDYNGTNLHVYGTHMQSDDMVCGWGQAALQRALNLEFWRMYIDDTKVPANELIILAGDFNIERNSAEFNSFLTNFGVDQPVSYLGHPHTLDTEDNSIARVNKGPSEYLDYVLLDKKHRAGVKSLTQTVLREKTTDFQVGSGTYNDYSDHYPVRAIIEVDLQNYH
ncbi:hypothetical protein BGZ92_005438 [Podila epicladia]|nr:hypothetical protein BGZ92_005438 [Podila epicladia]